MVRHFKPLVLKGLILIHQIRVELSHNHKNLGEVYDRIGCLLFRLAAYGDPDDRKARLELAVHYFGEEISFNTNWSWLSPILWFIQTYSMVHTDLSALREFKICSAIDI